MAISDAWDWATIKLLREAGSDDDDNNENATGQNQPSTGEMSE